MTRLEQFDQVNGATVTRGTWHADIREADKAGVPKTRI
jgi:hypothetical protein